VTTIINLYGGPGIGKSTVAAHLFFLMKKHGQDVELVREYAKEWAWQGKKIEQYDQFYILGHQIHRETSLYGKVDFIVTDSPVLLNLAYASKYCASSVARGIGEAIHAFYRQCEEDGHLHIHVLLERTHVYVQDGRYENEQQAIEIDKLTQQLLVDARFSYETVPSDVDVLRLFDGIVAYARSAQLRRSVLGCDTCTT